MKAKQCEGWRRIGGAFTLGPVHWKQCNRDASVMLTVKQDGKTETLPSCVICWNEAMEKGIPVLKVTPLSKEAKRIHRELIK